MWLGFVEFTSRCPRKVAASIWPERADRRTEDRLWQGWIDSRLFGR